ncbi:hypothetical protein [Bacteroides ovatus]|uniref:hypothetical protein n=1 Tax=Bacteroides ovatus TaxID=28116 RepID=UPI0035616F76
MNSEIIEVKRDDLRELYQVLTNYPAISKEQVKNEMHKVFGEDTFKPKDIMERVKTFKDACRELGLDSEDLEQKWGDNNLMPDEIAYQKLRIICAALNEGWEPQFTEDEWRYYPWFWLYTQEEINDMDEDEKTNRRLMSTGDYQTGYAGLASANSTNAPSATNARIGSRLCLKSDTLAVYCGKQFINIWADYILIRK